MKLHLISFIFVTTFVMAQAEAGFFNDFISPVIGGIFRFFGDGDGDGDVETDEEPIKPTSGHSGNSVNNPPKESSGGDGASSGSHVEPTLPASVTNPPKETEPAGGAGSGVGPTPPATNPPKETAPAGGAGSGVVPNPPTSGNSVTNPPKDTRPAGTSGNPTPPSGVPSNDGASKESG